MGQDHKSACVIDSFSENADRLKTVAVAGHMAFQTHRDDVAQRSVHLVSADQYDILFAGESLKFRLLPTIMLGDHRSSQSQTLDLGYHLFGSQRAVGTTLVCVHVEVK